MAVEVEVPRRLFSVEEYHRMAETGILRDKERVELIEGEIVQMAPIGTRHFGCVINVNRLCLARLGDRAVVSPQGPVVIAAPIRTPAGSGLTPAACGALQSRASDSGGRAAGGRGGGYDRPL